MRLFHGTNTPFRIRILKQKKWDPSKPDSSNVGVQLRKYHKEEITFEEFLKKLKFPKGITFQYFFATEKAISKLKRL